jgi:hypothetical protein
MRSVLHNLLVVAIALTLFGATSRVLRQPPKIRPLVDLKTGETFPVLDAATIERVRQWRLKPQTSYVKPPAFVPPPPNHESILRIKATS